MTFSKEIKLYMRSSIRNLDSEGSPEISEEKYEARLTSCDNGAKVTYSESAEGGKIFSEITLLPDCITVKKSGAIESLMVFKAGEVYESIYSVPPFSFDMKISTKALKCSIFEGGGEATVLYRMEIGGALKSCSMKITLGEGSKV